MVLSFNYIKLHDINEVVRYIFVLANKKLLPRPIFNTTDVAFSFTDFDLNRVDLMHFFNAISFGTTPWITTFETIVPRFKSTLSCHHGRNCGYSSLIHEPKVLKGLEALSSDSCKKLISMSECNLSMQTEFLRNFPQYRSEIERKLTCLHPPQHLLVDDYASKQLPLDGQIRFLFVGSAFFRKGGIEILEAFQEARRNNGYNLKLTIVSSLTLDNYATREKQEDVERVKKIIEENRDWVEYWGHLENKRVLELMEAAHIGLLPTYADTYGYSVLEFQAAGCPVISTNVRALPEINNNEIGWVIEIPKNRLGEAIYTTEEDRGEIGRAIRGGLTSAIAEIMDNRQVILRKANAALKHIRDHHSPEEFSRRLGEIYHRALQ
jgi:glycosyltransferase involved in cell wall biosynthesis